MKIIGEKLRVAREASGRSIDDIALATRINRQFLIDIEQGTPLALPKTYIRAFIADYAREVGLNPVDLLIEYESSVSTTGTSHPNDEAAVNDEEFSHLRSTIPQYVPIKKFHKHQFRVLLIVIVFIVAGFIITIFWMRRENTPKPIQEISFSEVVKEQEQRINPLINNIDSMKAGDLPSKTEVHNDSLFLEGIASESVWVRIVIDGNPAIEYTLPRFYKKQWKAKKSFIVSMGNAAGISFTLNGQKMGSLSPTKRPMKNVAINWETLGKIKNRYP